jgi:hypothetical protein
MSAHSICVNALPPLNCRVFRGLSQAIIAFTLVALYFPVHARDADMLRVPPGFTIETLPFEVPNARQMALTDDGHLIIGTRKQSNVYALRRSDHAQRCGR